MRFEEWTAPTIEHGQLTKWNWLVQHPENLLLGEKTDIGAFTYINSKYGVEIHDYAQIGSHCSIYSESTIDNKQAKVIIGKNARIGSHSTVMPGVTIGDNAVVGAHSFVNKDIPADVVAYGVPAKTIRTQPLSLPIPLAKPEISDEEIAAVNRVLRSGILSLGPELNQFEEEFASTIGTKYAVAVNSGTSGLHLALRSLNIGEGDEVITSPFSFIASANCILYEKGKPVFIDVEEGTFNIDAKKIETAITHRTKALLIPHIFGQSCDMTKIMAIAKKYRLVVIEDACESILSTHQGKNAGTFGDVAVFAFYPNKQMTTGEGGMIVTDKKEIYEYCKSAANQGRSDNRQWLTHDKLGYNYRMDEMSCALGRVQLKRISSFIQRRQEIVDRYNHLLNEYQEVNRPKVLPENNSSWFVYPIRVAAGKRDGLIQKLAQKNIQSKAYFFPCIHLQPFYQKDFGYKEGDFPIAEKLSRETLILPLFPSLTEEQVSIVADAVKRSMEELKDDN